MIVISAFVFAGLVHAQTTSALIRGTVTDPKLLPIPGAKVGLTDMSTANTRTTTTDSNGIFIFPALNPGTYQLQVESAGFKTLQQTGVVLAASEQRSVGSIVLQLGAVSESVSVSAEAVQVQTASGENSALISEDQIDNLQSRGRDPITLLRVLPGVNGSADNDAAGGAFGTATPTINGIRQNFNNVTIDGQNRMNTDVTGTDDALLSMDAIQEVKVLTNGYQAEYGRNAGGTVNIVTKGGTRSFHGTAYEFLRNEALNANSYLRKQTASTAGKPALYRYNTFGGTIGGPVFIPGKFNTNRDKLFFFYNFEKFLITTPGNLLTSQLPTLAERSGDFSQSGQVGSSKVVPKDPLTGLPFPNNKIPSAGSPGCGVTFSCMNPVGQAILNYFPAPFTGSALANIEAVSGNSYNYQYQDIISDPKYQQGLRLDFNPTDKNNFTLTLRQSVMDQKGWANIIGGPSNANFQNFYGHYRFGEQGGVFNYRRIFTPTLVNELSAGYAATSETGAKLTPTSWDHITRSKVGFGSLGQLYPSNNPNDLIPNLHFTLPNNQTGPNFGLDVNNRFPIIGYDVDIDALDNLSYTHGFHLFKAGFYYEHDTSYRGLQGQSRGDFTWRSDSNDPYQTGNPFTDALIGHFGQYIEATKLASAKNVAQLAEWFVQDSYKVTSHLTLELGLRMGMAGPWVFIHGDAAGFYPESYNKSTAPLLILARCVGDTVNTPAHNCGSAANRRGVNPVTGQTNLPAALIGFYGSTDQSQLSNGSFAATQPGYTHGFTTGTGFQLSPRAGFSWDVFGNGKTAIRGNGAIMRNMLSSNGVFVNGAKVNPPTTFNPTSFYGNVSSYAGQPGYLGQAGFLSPGNVTGWQRQFKPPTIYQYGLSVQHQIAHNTIAEVAYVGNQGRFLPEVKALNTLPYGTRFQASSVDPTNGGVLLDTLNPALPIPGYNGVNETYWGGGSNYNGLQVQVNRRYSKNMLFGGAYTWSKTMDYGTGLPLYSNVRTRVYGLSSSDQTHVLTFNYTYYVPKLSKLVDSGFIREVFDGWQWSGITSFADGTPGSVTFAAVGGVDWLGGGGGTNGDAQRVNVTGPLQLSKGTRNYGKYFATQNIAMPAKGDPGNAGRVSFRNPGTSNWDMNLSKTFPLGSDRYNLLFRWEAYNVFNHPQFTSVNATATYNTSTGQLSVPTTGATAFGGINPSTARTPRIMQGSLRFSF
jgi:hypothetical protein